MDPRKSKTRAGIRAGDELQRAGETAGIEAGTDEHAAVATGDTDRSAPDVDDAGASSRSVGAVAVEVDRPAILAEAAAIAASSNDAPAPAGELEPALAGADVNAKAADVAPAVRLLVAQCTIAFAPNWEITQAESDGVGDAAALVMAHWMPDGVLEPKYLAIITLATSLYGVAGKRRLEDGSWVPLRKPRAPASSSPTSPAPGPAPAGALRLQ